jgi:hypothetical protein
MRKTTLRVALCLAGLAGLPVFAGDDPGPVLRKGLWRFERTFDYADGRAPGEPLTSEKCADPLELGDEQLAMMRRMGCSAERSRAGVAEWRHRVTCDRPGLPRGSSTSVQTVSSPDAYEVRVVNEGELALTILRERLVAKRIGDC